MAIPNIPIGSGMPSFGSGGQNPLEKILDILGSKGGQVLTNAVGAGLSAYGQNKSAEADRAATAQQFAANMAQRQQESDQSDQRSRAIAAESASPLGQDQGYAQKMAIMNAILPGLRNFNITAGDPAVQKMRANITGGVRIPEGGFDPSMIERLFGDNATQAALAQHSKAVANIDPRAPMTNFESLYGKSADGSQNAFTTDTQSFAQQELARQDAERERQREIIRRALEEDIRGEKGGKSGGSKAKSALGGAASGAMTGATLGSIVPGIGTGIGAAVGGIGGFLKGLF